MSWEEPKVSCQQKQGFSRGKQARAFGLRLSQRVLRMVIACMVIAAAVGIVWAQDSHVVMAASLQQTSQSNPGTLAIVGAAGAQVYAAPGGESIQQLAPGTVLTAVGRSADNLWVVVHGDGGIAGWVEVSEVVLFGIEQLPVMVEGTVPAESASATAQPGSAPTTQVLLPTPTSTPLPTATPTASPTPTETPTPLPTPTSTPTTVSTAAATVAAVGGVSVPSGQTSLVAVVRGGGAGLYDSPGGSEIQQLVTGTALTAWGRSADGAWLVVVSSTGQAGWVEVANVVVFNVETLPVLDSAASVLTPEVPAAPAATTAPSEESAIVSGVATPSAPTSDTGTITARVSVTDARLNIRSGPGTGYRIVLKADPNDLFEVSGRNVEATWVELILPDNSYGWASVEFVEISRPILGLPVSDRLSAIPSEPTPAPTSVIAAGSATNTNAVNRVSAAPTNLSGRLVFQATNGGTIYVYDLASGSLRELTGGFDPAVSPDGKTVAFTRFGGDQGLYLIDIDGSNQRMIWNGGNAMRSPTWSADGRWIAFVRQSGTFRCRDVGFGICLPDNPFLSSFPWANFPEFNLSRVDFNGENFRDIPALNSAQAPNWNASGIVYQANTGIEITEDKDDITTRPLVQAPYYQDPAWQPNGGRVIFQSREGSHWEIFTINSDGGGLSALTRPVTALVENLPSNVAPAWSPDGQWIVYLSNRNDDNDAGDWRLWVMAADGSNQRPLPIDVPLEYTFTNEQVVSWGVSN